MVRVIFLTVEKIRFKQTDSKFLVKVVSETKQRFKETKCKLCHFEPYLIYRRQRIKTSVTSSLQL